MKRCKWLRRASGVLLGIVLSAGVMVSPAEAAQINTNFNIPDVSSVTNANGKNTVNFFDGDSYYNLEFDEKPSKQEILDELPSELTAYVGNYYKKVTISVTWTCAEDYDDSSYYYYQFNPVWDTSKYPKGQDTVTPYAICAFDEVSGIHGGKRSTVSTSASSSKNAQTIYQFLLKKGFNEASASGILANIQAESNFNPKALGDHGTSYGICQWHNGRNLRLQTYCSDNGYEVSSLDGQLHFLIYELKTSYSGIYSHMMNDIPNTERGAYEAARYWCIHFERPANKIQVSITRGNNARNVYEQYH